MLFPQVRDDLGVAVRDEAVSARFELRAPFDVVEQLAVEDDEDAPVLVGHWLLAVREADDAQPSRSQRRFPAAREILLHRDRDG